MSYRAPVADMLFEMKELAGLEAVSKLPGFEEAGRDTAQATAARWRARSPRRSNSCAPRSGLRALAPITFSAGCPAFATAPSRAQRA